MKVIIISLLVFLALSATPRKGSDQVLLASDETQNPWDNLNIYQAHAFVIQYEIFRANGYGQFIRQMFENFDSDKDDKLSLDEWLKLGKEFQDISGVSIKKDALTEVFNNGDQDNDSTIRICEATEILQAFVDDQIDVLHQTIDSGKLPEKTDKGSWGNLNIHQAAAIYRFFNTLAEDGYSGLVDNIYFFYDSDKSGSLNNNEWIKLGHDFQYYVGVKINEQDFDNVFKAIDFDSSSSVEPVEIQASLPHFFKAQINELEEIFFGGVSYNTHLENKGNKNPWMNLNIYQAHAFLIQYHEFQLTGYGQFIRHMFESFDEDFDDMLTREEWLNLGKAFQDIVGVEIDEESLLDALKYADINGDLQVEISEATALLEQFVDKQMELLLQAIGSNKLPETTDKGTWGNLNRHQAKAILGFYQRVSADGYQGLLDDILTHYDPDNSGDLDINEWHGLGHDFQYYVGVKISTDDLEGVFKHVDANGDGKLDRNELQGVLSYFLDEQIRQLDNRN